MNARVLIVILFFGLLGWLVRGLVLEIVARRAQNPPVPKPRDDVPGETDANPLTVPTAAVVETRLDGQPCGRCGTPTRVREHLAREGLREVTLHCPHCALDATRFVRITTVH